MNITSRVVSLTLVCAALSACAKKPAEDPYATSTAGGETAGAETPAGRGPEADLGSSDPSVTPESGLAPEPVAPGGEAPAQ